MLSLSLALAAALAAPQDDRPVNVVVFVADDLGAMDLGCTGSTFYETPNIDRLASEGVRFTNAYAACQVCSPTRVSLMTGQYPGRLNTTDYFGGRRKGLLLPAPYDDFLAHEHVTVAEALREEGYATAFFGKWHLGGEGFWPTDQGFDANFGGFTRGHPPQGYFSPYGMPTLEDGPEGEHLTGRLTEECLGWLDENADEPFLVWFSYYAVHTPLQARADLREKFEAKAAALPEPDGPKFLPEGTRQARQVQDHAVYAGMIAAMDESVGQVVAKLEELGVAEDTFILFTSDNGGLSTSEGSPTSNVPLRAGKGWMYEGGIRVPMIASGSGVYRRGETQDMPVHSNDVFPTILHMTMLDQRPEDHLDGLSFGSWLQPIGLAPPRRTLYWHYPHYGNQGGRPSGAVRMGRYKLIEWFEDGRVELFDLAADVGETNDLAGAEPEIRDELHAALRAWQQDVGARMPTPNPDWNGD